MIRHIVLWRLKDEAQGRSREENAREIKKQLEALNGHVPGLIRIEVGLDESRTPDSADISLYSEFESTAAFDAYLKHPLHELPQPLIAAATAERRLADSQAPGLLSGVLRSLSVGVVVLDRTGRIAYVNPAAVELLGLTADAVAGQMLFSGPPPARELWELEGPFWAAMADPGQPLDVDRDFGIKTAAGRREVRAHLTRVDLDGEPYGLLTVEDNGRIRRTERALKAALGEAEDRALRDPLTGLFNRRHIEPVLDAELNRAQRLEAPVSLLVIDLDHFKSVNDRFGHPMGDRVLVEFARLLSRILRVGDTPGRTGGEEFCVVLPHSDSDAARRAAERLHRVIRALRFEEEPELRVTASIGVATARFDAAALDLRGESERLFARADAALYQAKHEGRNRTCVAPPDDSRVAAPAPDPAPA